MSPDLTVALMHGNETYAGGVGAYEENLWVRRQGLEPRTRRLRARLGHA
jgi:hypothetical protein